MFGVFTVNQSFHTDPFLHSVKDNDSSECPCSIPGSLRLGIYLLGITVVTLMSKGSSTDYLDRSMLSDIPDLLGENEHGFQIGEKHFNNVGFRLFLGQMMTASTAFNMKRKRLESEKRRL